MAERIPASASFPERMERHENKNWYNIGFNHKTTATMGLLVPLACKEVYPGERVILSVEIKKRFAALFLPIMHQCYYTLDWFYVSYAQLFDYDSSWQNFIKQDPMNATYEWAWFTYARADAIYTDGILNYLGFNAPPEAGTLIASTPVGAMPVFAYVKIYDEYYRNDQIQAARWVEMANGNNTTTINTMIPDLRAFRRNWPRDYYTSATIEPQQGDNILIPSYSTDPVTGLFVPQAILQLDGDPSGNGPLISDAGILKESVSAQTVVLQLSSTIRDFRYASDMTEFLERQMRSGDRYNDFVERMFGWKPNPLYIDRPVWIGGYTGSVMIQEVMSTAESGTQLVGDYAGQALASDGTPQWTYQVPDYGFIMCMYTCYPKASYYSGLDNMWRRVTKMDYMWEQFAYIGDQPITNKEVWFSWYSSDADWNDEIFGYLPQYAQHRYSNDIVSGQMRTLWESFHLGRKFTAASQVVLNSDFITCTPDVGRVFDVDAEAGEHEIYMHAYLDINVFRALPKNALPQL